MKVISKLVFTAAATVAAFVGVGVAATGAAHAQQTVLIGNATANDTQAAINDKLAELITKYSKFCTKHMAPSAVPVSAPLVVQAPPPKDGDERDLLD